MIYRVKEAIAEHYSSLLSPSLTLQKTLTFWISLTFSIVLYTLELPVPMNTELESQIYLIDENIMVVIPC